ncbi:MAG: helicase-related protein [Candidatus Hermodarchaeota archaeon]
MLEHTILEERQYQRRILDLLIEYKSEASHCIVELDCGLGKRVLIYLLVEKLLKKERSLILVDSTTSFQETLSYLQGQYGGVSDLGYLSSRVPSHMRMQILETRRVILSTPQTLANALQKMPEKPKFDVIIINEVDKVVRRTATNQVLIFPFNSLIGYFTQFWVVGLSGTIRDSHVVYQKEQFSVRRELESLGYFLQPLRVITMDELTGTDIDNHITKTNLVKVPIEDPNLAELLERLDSGIDDARREIISQTEKENPELLENLSKQEIAQLAFNLPAEDSLVQKYRGSLLVRKYVTSMMPWRFKRFLYNPQLEVDKELIDSLNNKSEKVQKVGQLVRKAQKTVVIVSYVETAKTIYKYLETLGIMPFLITGAIKDKQSIIQAFRDSKSQSTIIMTSVGERDIDLPTADQMIVFDSINTTKTMYQRIKRTRGGTVYFLYYKETYEERKIERLIKNILNKYPWSTIDLGVQEI